MRPDGKVVRTPELNTVIIDVGLSDQITQGMTFEVYDAHTGIPVRAVGKAENDPPQGKASIQVIRMLPGFSECRIIRRAPGHAIAIGDLIVKRRS